MKFEPGLVTRIDFRDDTCIPTVRFISHHRPSELGETIIDVTPRLLVMAGETVGALRERAVRAAMDHLKIEIAAAPA